MNAVTYCRISGENDERTASLDTQEELAIEFALSQGYTVTHSYRERYSGAELYDRSVLSEIRVRITNKEFDAVICHSIDRLSRDPVHLMILVEEAERSGVKLLFTTENLDHSSEGKLVSYVRGYAAAMEREKIRERTTRARDQITKQGKLVGHGKPLYGYNFDKETRKRTINDPEASVVRRIFELAASGMTPRPISIQIESEGHPSPSVSKGSRKSCLWSARTISDILSNEAYYGETNVKTFVHKKQKNGKVVTERNQRRPERGIRLPDDVTPPIVTREQFDCVRAITNSRRASPQRSRSLSGPLKDDTFLMRGRVKCGVCGKVCWPARASKNHSYYRCQSYRATSAKKCPGKAVRKEWLDSVCWGVVREKIIENPSELAAATSILAAEDKTIAESHREIEILNGKITKQRSLAEKIYKSWRLEESSDLADRLLGDYRETMGLINKIESEISQIRGRIAIKGAPGDIKKFIEEAASLIQLGAEAPTFEMKRKMIEAFGVIAMINGQEDTRISLSFLGITVVARLGMSFGGSEENSCSLSVSTKRASQPSVALLGPWELVRS